jgi:hypothetical protein
LWSSYFPAMSKKKEPSTDNLIIYYNMIEYIIIIIIIIIIIMLCLMYYFILRCALGETAALFGVSGSVSSLCFRLLLFYIRHHIQFAMVLLLPCCPSSRVAGVVL